MQFCSISQNTFILKRRWEPHLSAKGKPHRRLKPRHFVYDFVDDTNTIRKPDVSVILTDYVDGIGYRGDLVKTRPNKAYNDLILTGLAVYDTPENRKLYNTEARLNEVRQSPFIKRTITVFGYRLVNVCMNKFKPWIIEPWHVRTSMRKAGLLVQDDAQIEMPKTPITGPDLEKENKHFYVTVTINQTEKARVRCNIHHVTLDPKQRLPYVPEFWKRGELLFPDDETQRPLETNDRAIGNSESEGKSLNH